MSSLKKYVISIEVIENNEDLVIVKNVNSVVFYRVYTVYIYSIYYIQCI